MLNQIVLSFIVIVLYFLWGYGVNKLFNKIFSSELWLNNLIHRILLTLRVISYVLLLILCLFSILIIFEVDIKNIITWVWIFWLLFTLIWKDYLTNFFSSIIFLLNWVVKIWDKIKIWTLEWEVLEMTINYTKLKNKNNEVLFYPNKKLSWEPIEHIKKFS